VFLLPAAMIGIWSLRCAALEVAQIKSSLTNQQMASQDLRDVLSELDSFHGESASEVHQSVQQIRSLISEAIATLNNSFMGMEQQSSSQVELMSELSGRIQGAQSHSVSINHFVKQTGAEMAGLVHSLNDMSRHSSKVAERSQQMVTQMDAIVQLLTDVTGIAEQSRPTYWH